MCIHHEPIDIPVLRIRETDIGVNPQSSPGGYPKRLCIRGCFIAMQLCGFQTCISGKRINFIGRHVDKNAYGPTREIYTVQKLCCLNGGNPARGMSVDNKTEIIRSGLKCIEGIVTVRNATDFNFDRHGRYVNAVTGLIFQCAEFADLSLNGFR